MPLRIRRELNAGATGQALLTSALDSGPALDPIERAEATRLLSR